MLRPLDPANSNFRLARDRKSRSKSNSMRQDQVGFLRMQESGVSRSKPFETHPLFVNKREIISEVSNLKVLI